MAVACRWLEAGEVADSLSVGGNIEAVTAARLFALVCMLAGEAPAAQAQWRKRTGRAVLEAVQQEVSSDGV